MHLVCPQPVFPISCRRPESPLSQESPRQTKQKKGPIFVNSGLFPWGNKHDSHQFCQFRSFSLGKQARFTYRTFVPECPPGKVHELAFLWFGLPGPLLNKLKTTPTPNKNGSYGIKGGGSVRHKSRSSYAIKVSSCTTFSV